MADTLVYVKTYACPNCPFTPDHDPRDEAWLRTTFFEDRYAGLPLGDCPACYAGENPQHKTMASHLETITGADFLPLMNQKSVASDTTLENSTVEVTDERGQSVMEQTGSRWELAVEQSTGSISSVEVPVMAPKMRDQTDQELADLKEQRDRNLDALERVALKEV